MVTATTQAIIVVHGGAGAGRALDDGCDKAARAAGMALEHGGDALDAAVAAVVALEDDERFNAGTGAALGLDGQTIEMDAGLMDTLGRLGAVSCIRAVKNPILVARDVARTPHCVLSASGAQRFARKMGHPPYDVITAKARREHALLMEKLSGEQNILLDVSNEEFLRYWNYANSPAFKTQAAPDTVGAVVRDATGQFAVAGSTGGSAPSLLGRVGDTPIVGSGFYAGPAGAVAATGVGEYIIRTMLANTVYQWLAAGVPLQQALQRGVDLIPPEIHVGLIAVSRTESGACSNADMPHATFQPA